MKANKNKKQKVKEESQSKKKDIVPQKTKEQIEKEKKEQLDNLHKNLIKKLYQDLFSQNVELYQEKNLTFENFLFDFYKDIEASLDFTNPDYPNLLKKIDLIVKAKFAEREKLSSNLNSTEIKKELNRLSQEDEWALIYNYRKAMFEEEKKQRKAQKLERAKKYEEELNKQIQIRSQMKYQDIVDKSKDEVYNYDEAQQKETIEKLKVDNQVKIQRLKIQYEKNDKVKKIFLKELEEQNLNLSDSTKDVFVFKLDFLKNLNENEETGLFDNIMKETKMDKIKKMLLSLKYKRELDEQINSKIKTIERPDKMTTEERKINKDLLEASRQYFKYKK